MKKYFFAFFVWYFSVIQNPAAQMNRLSEQADKVVSYASVPGGVLFSLSNAFVKIIANGPLRSASATQNRR